MIQRILRQLSWIAKPAAVVAAVCALAIPLSSPAQLYVGFNIGTPPPPMPYYSQPALTVPGQMWEPGYWAWGAEGYYWVPGTWVTPPADNTYWTPGYWGYDDGAYSWNNGYWGPSVGYYGGINYGYGYPGIGYVGGAWNNGVFGYNTAVTNVNRSFVHNVYVNRRIVVTHVVTRSRASFNGPNGVRVRPTAAQLAAARARRFGATRAQIDHARIAARDRDLLASVNHGRPAVGAVARPIDSTRSIPHFHAVTTHATVHAQTHSTTVEHRPAGTTTVHAHTNTTVHEQSRPAQRRAAPVTHQAAPVRHEPEAVHAAPAMHTATVQHSTVHAAPRAAPRAPARHSAPSGNQRQQGRPPH